MKAIKKLMAALLAVAMLCAMAVPAFAADQNGTITISDAAVGETYDIYQMFVLDSFNVEEKAYSYTVNPAWTDFFKADAAGADYVSLNNGHPTWINAANDEATAGEFAKKAIAWAKANNVKATASKQASTETVEFTGLELGYYLVDTSLGALCNLTTTARDAQINEKNDKPDVDKKVKEDDAWSNTSNAKIGDTVEYEVTITVQKGTEGYVLKDTMSEGLTFNAESVKVTVGGEDVSAANYTLNDNPGDGLTFTLSFEDSYIATLTAGTKIKVNYTATLNNKAAIGTDGNINSATLKYGNSSETTKKQTTTYTYQFDLIKVDGTTNELLEGAHFKLYDAAEGGNEIKLVKEADGSYRVAVAGETAVDYIETNKNAPIRIKGLDNKVYYLEEILAPEGYNRLTARAEVNLVDGSSTTNMTSNKWDSTVEGGVKVTNNAGATLPSTGGMGTTLFYVIGGGLMIAAVVLLVTKKRMEKN